ncbi:hypothetical protein AMTR_s00052p00143130 [Amborella trichopoda]|uniref:Uncharacterized protein n=1 Tax=Amborella trichopoda TaxID=13333 RepID=U5D1U7_AMBTC|nr:hypothetical protein AMTR_s00052p00143130 [Amborella trichopoda]
MPFVNVNKRASHILSLLCDMKLLVEKEDRNYLWKLTAGSIGGGALIKYGSILVPEITRPNLLQALVIIGLPVLLGVLVLIKASSADANSNWTPH